jgi:hypothetical protein
VAAVSGQQVAALRTALMLDQGRAHELRAGLVRAGGLQGFGELAYAAFLLAVRRRFGPAWTRGDVVRYVGSVRAHGPDDDDFDPLAAETLILRALGGGAPPVAGEEAAATPQAILLIVLIIELELDVGGLDRFLTEARELADRWLAEL